MSAITRAISSRKLRFPSRATTSVFARLCLPLSLRKTRAVGSRKLRDMRQAGIGEGTTQGDELGGPARALSSHDSGVRQELSSPLDVQPVSTLNCKVLAGRHFPTDDSRTTDMKKPTTRNRPTPFLVAGLQGRAPHAGAVSGAHRRRHGGDRGRDRDGLALLRGRQQMAEPDVADSGRRPGDLDPELGCAPSWRRSRDRCTTSRPGASRRRRSTTWVRRSRSFVTFRPTTSPSSR